MAETRSCDEELKAAFPPIVKDDAAQGEFSHFLVPKDLLPAITHYLHTQPNLHGRLTLYGLSTIALGDTYGLYYLFTLEPSRRWVLLSQSSRGTIGYSLHHAAHSCREVVRTGDSRHVRIDSAGHPDLRRLIRHEHAQRDTPAQEGLPLDRVLGRQQGEHHFRRIEGEGVFEVPVGPIHAGSLSQAISVFRGR